MKLAGILFLIFLTQTSLTHDHKTITFSGKEVPLKSILRIIKCQTDVGFFYDASLLKEVKPVSVDWNNVKLEAALNEIFNNLQLVWILENNTVTVFKKPAQVIPTLRLRYFMTGYNRIHR